MITKKSLELLLTRHPETNTKRLENLLGRLSAKNKICLIFDLDPTKIIITLLTQPEVVSEACTVMATVETHTMKPSIKILAQIPDTQLLIKLHPQDAEEYDVPENARITRDYLFDILEASDVCISNYSTTFLAAAILDKPMVQILHIFPRVEINWYGGVLETYVEGLEQAVNDALYNKEVRERLRIRRKVLVKEQCGEIDGRATERIVEAMKKLEKGGEMTKQKFTFQDYLSEEHTLQVEKEVTMLIAFPDWLEKLSMEDWITLGNRFALKKAFKSVERIRESLIGE